MLPVPSTMPVTVARASWLPLSASCLPRSAEMAELIMEEGPPMKKPVMASRAALVAWSLGEPAGVGVGGGLLRGIGTRNTRESKQTGGVGINTHGCIPPGRPWRAPDWPSPPGLASPCSQTPGPERFRLTGGRGWGGRELFQGLSNAEKTRSGAFKGPHFTHSSTVLPRLKTLRVFTSSPRDVTKSAMTAMSASRPVPNLLWSSAVYFEPDSRLKISENG